ncbi:hypothetical protein FI667_g12598, partial [Globisporangium splendens]
MSDDGHLYLSARGGVEYAGDSRHSWYDDAHRSVLVLSPRSHKLREIALDASLDVEGRIGAVRGDRKGARSRSDEDDEDEDDDDGEDKIRQRSALHCGVSVVYDFAAQYYHAEETASGRSGHVVAEKEGSMELVALMKLSLDKQFLAVQTSDIEVQVIRLATREKFWIMCKPNAGNRILTDGIVWNVHASTPGSSQDLFLITKMGIEQYRVSIKRRNCALHRSIGVYIHAFWYAASHGVLIISTGSRANEIVPYLLRGSSVEKLPRLVFSTSVGKNDLYLAPLYGQLYAVYGDTRSTKLLLYLVERNKVSCTRSLNLLLPPGTALEYSVVDNLLVCHSLDFNVSLFFDIKCDGNVNDPFSHPLPISLRAPAHDSRLLSPSSSSSEELPVHDIESMDGETIDTLTEEDSSYPSSSSSKHHIRRARSADGVRLRLTFDDENAQVFSVDDGSTLAQQSGDTRKKVARLERAMTTMHMGKMDHHQFEMNGHYFSRWRFLPPNLVQRSFSVKGRKDLMEQVEVRKLQVNLRGICRSSARHREVFPFLLRRGDQMLAKTLVLKLVYDTLQEDDLSLPAVVNLFNAVQTMTHDDLDQGVADESPNDTSSDEERSVSTRSAASSSLLSQRDLAPQRSSSFRARGFSENMSKSGGDSGHVPSMPSRNAHGFLLIYQSEFCHQVWSALLPDSMIARNGKLSVYLSELIKNLRSNMVPVESLTRYFTQCYNLNCPVALPIPTPRHLIGLNGAGRSSGAAWENPPLALATGAGHALSTRRDHTACARTTGMRRVIDCGFTCAVVGAGGPCDCNFVAQYEIEFLRRICNFSIAFLQLDDRFHSPAFYVLVCIIDSMGYEGIVIVISGCATTPKALVVLEGVGSREY